MKHAIVLSVLATSLLFNVTILAAEKVQWYKCDMAVQQNLLNGKWNICDIAKKLSSEEPKNATEALTRLSIMLRAGMDKQAIETVEQLKDFYDDIADNFISVIYYNAGDKYDAWDVSKAILEAMPDKTYDAWLPGRLTNYLVKSGWSVEDIDKWMATQQQKAQQAEPKEKKLPYPFNRRGSDYWVTNRIQFLTTMGKERPLAEEFVQNLKKDPHDTRSMNNYLELVGQLSLEKRGPYDVLKVAQLYEPLTAPEANMIANRLATLEQWKESLRFLKMALEIPLTDKDVAWFSWQQQVFLSADAWKKQFRIRVLNAAAERELKLDNPAEAKKYADEAATLGKDVKWNRNMYLAGRVDAANPTTSPSESKPAATETEKLSSDTPKYWMEQAAYYAGAGNIKKQEEAYKKVLELAKPVPPRRGKGSADERTMALLQYTNLLKKLDREKEACDLLLNEMKTTGPETASSQAAGRQLGVEFSDMVNPDEPIIWNWLDSQKSWEYSGDRLLWAIFRNANQGLRPAPGMPGIGRGRKRKINTTLKLNECFERAKKMAKGNFERSYILGCIMVNIGQPQQGRPLLEKVLQNAPEQNLKSSAAGVIFSSYVNEGNWKKAQTMLKDRTVSIDYDRLCSLAEQAAKADDQKSAMSLWKNAANCNLRNFNLVRDLANAGMKDELIGYYDEIAKKLPESVAPAEAMKILNARQ